MTGKKQITFMRLANRVMMVIISSNLGNDVQKISLDDYLTESTFLKVGPWNCLLSHFLTCF
jgi:hypothetical protein